MIAYIAYLMLFTINEYSVMDFTLKRLGPPHLYKQNKLVKPSEMFPIILMWFSYNKNKKRC